MGKGRWLDGPNHATPALLRPGGVVLLSVKAKPGCICIHSNAWILFFPEIQSPLAETIGVSQVCPLINNPWSF